MKFSKWHALGNTYLLLERGELDGPLDADGVRRLCDVHRGVGADGVLEIVEIRGPEAEVVVWNPDGSTAELSGNGARIAAMWLARRSGVAFPRLRIGDRSLPARVDGVDVEIDLGEVVVGKPLALDVGGERLEVTPVTVGNPHAVIRRDPSREELLRIGPAVETHEQFPGRTNVQLVRAVGAKTWRCSCGSAGWGRPSRQARAPRRRPLQPSRTAGVRRRCTCTSRAGR
jgi:diaminopimelate epimerase